jgi:hypothetical protein
VTRISILGLGALLAFAGTPAPGQDFTAGKTPAQLFSSDCAECHRTPNGLAKNRDVKNLASFLREHYTTKSDTAGSLAAYVSGFAGSGPADASAPSICRATAKSAGRGRTAMRRARRPAWQRRPPHLPGRPREAARPHRARLRTRRRGCGPI